MITKILVANRGEIAVRIIRTARDLGYRIVAVYSDADVDALHVRMADEAVFIGAAPANESYLAVESILAAAKITSADAIHPGYGFLSENAGFARACRAAGVIFIGPPPDAIELMGNKRLAKLAIIKAGVPCIPGYQGEEQSDEELMAKASEVGFPIMIKASAGGGGRGMRLVFRQKDMREKIKIARTEAQMAFGSDELILERAVIKPRHIEIQVFADAYGNVIYLGERDCSVQRRNQKVVEEAPSPFVDEELRQRMGEAAVSVAKACHYQGAGTVEFLVDLDRNFYFLEMNTRLQVEHPVTEMITGQDLVAWQIAVADGDPLPMSQDEVQLQGHSIEVRLYAENPTLNFMPQTGQIVQWRVPERSGIRIDTGIQTGQTVSPHYDPMLAKLIAWGETREIARRRLASAIQDTVLLGVSSNKHFLKHILEHPAFVQGEVTTAFIEQHFPALLNLNNPSKTDNVIDQNGDVSKPLALAGLIFYLDGREASLEGFRLSREASGYYFHLKCDPQPDRNETGSIAVHVAEREDVFTIQLFGKSYVFESPSAFWFREMNLASPKDAGTVPYLTYSEDGVRKTIFFSFCPQHQSLFLDDGDCHISITNQTLIPTSATNRVVSGEIKASMDGTIAEVAIEQGDRVEAGQNLIVLESMKMLHTFNANISGVVEQLHVNVGDQVRTRQILAIIVE